MDESTEISNGDESPRRPAKCPAQFLPSISKQTADLLLRQENAVDVIALYFFYLYTSTWQCTNRIRATTGFCVQGLGISRDRIRRAKKRLVQLGLIADHRTLNKAKRITGWYVHVKYIRRASHPVPIPVGGVYHPVDEKAPNALNADNQSASIAFNKNALEPPSPLQGEGGIDVLDWKKLASQLLTCLKQSPDRELTDREVQVLRSIGLKPTPEAFEELRWFYKAKFDDDHPYDIDQRLLRSRKLKLVSLANDLPQQLELAKQWTRIDPIPRPPPPPPDKWQEIQQTVYPDSNHFSSFEDLPDYAKTAIRQFAAGGKRSHTWESPLSSDEISAAQTHYAAKVGRFA